MFSLNPSYEHEGPPTMVEIDVNVLGGIINTLRNSYTACGDIVNADDNGDPYTGSELEFVRRSGQDAYWCMRLLGIPEEKIVYPGPDHRP
jgi:hypothetical protein